MVVLTAASLALSAVLLCAVFYNQFMSAIHADIKEIVELLRGIPSSSIPATLDEIAPDDMRVTLIAPDGIVLYDNTVPFAALPNHADREEFKQALASGFGESKRLSDTLGRETWYYAVRLPDGNVLRAAKTTWSIFFVFKRALPVVVFVVLAVAVIGYAVAGRLTKRIVEPINNSRFDGELIPPYDEFAPYMRAIAEQREQIAAQIKDMRERSETLHTIMENMSEGAVLLDRKGTILSANRSALDIFGAAAPMEGRNVIELLRDIALLEYARGALAGHRGESYMERAGRDYHAYFCPVTTGGAILLFLDTTERMRAEKLRREFSANISHELKTPLTSISGYAELLAGGMAREEDKTAFLRKIRSESARLITLIEDIMLLSRLDERKTEGAFENVDIAEIVAETAEALASKAAEMNVSINVSGENIVVHAHRSLMSELFFNLMDNALKYNRPGGTVTATVSQKDGRAAASVSDTGIGIPKEEQSRVFERFYRVDKSRSTKSGGTGLGLAIAKHIAAIHHAEITLDSREDEGTTVTVVFAT